MLSFDVTIPFDEAVENYFKLTNFSKPEDGFAWSQGKWCEISFSCSEAPETHSGIIDLLIDVDVFRAPPAFEGQDIFLYFNGLRILSLRVTGRILALASVSRALLRMNDNVITIDSPDIVNPSDYGVNEIRKLGVQIFSIKLATG